MKLFKRFNLLDYIILGALLVAVCFGIYNFLPGGEREYRISISLDESVKISEGELCGDFSAKNDLGKAFPVSEKELYVLASGRKEAHGIRVDGQVYLENMPVKLYIGDVYAEGKIREIRVND